jgi:hypothetical protein
MRSLESLALSKDALKNLPGRYARPVTVPPQGALLTCTLKTDIKMANRTRGSGPSPSSAGGTAFTIGNNLPSAGLRMRFAPTGALRSGSRKNATTQTVTGSRTRPSHNVTAKPKRFRPAAIAINRQPCGWMGSFNDKSFNEPERGQGAAIRAGAHRLAQPAAPAQVRVSTENPVKRDHRRGEPNLDPGNPRAQDVRFGRSDSHIAAIVRRRIIERRRGSKPMISLAI